MTSYDGLVLTFIFFGGILCVVSFIIIKSMKKQTNQNKTDYSDEEHIVYEEIRHKIFELNEYGEFLKSELDGKHKELLFLYQMVSEKERAIQKKSSENKEDGITNEVMTEGVNESETISKNEITANEIQEFKEIQYNKKILDLSLEGYSNQEIAKRLNIGTGQVELVLNLFK